MKMIWTMCGAAACMVALAAAQSAEIPVLVVTVAVTMMVLTWL